MVWRMTSEVLKIAIGRKLRLEFLEPAIVRWSVDYWSSIQDANAVASGLGTYICDLPTENLANGSCIVLPSIGRSKISGLAGTNYRVAVGDGGMMTAT